MLALVRACSYKRHLGSSQALAFHARFLADRGLNRKDYTDPGYQASGYINPSWYSNTHEGRFKSPCPRAPVYCGNTIDEEELAKKTKKKKRVGDARKQYEESKATSGEADVRVYSFNRAERESDRSSSSSEPSWEVENDDLRQQGNRVLPPRVSVMDEDTPELEILSCQEKKKKPKKPPKKKRLFKGRIETDYADFGYSDSGLDEYTNKIKEKDEKKIRELEEFLAMKKTREKKPKGEGDQGDHTI